MDARKLEVIHNAGSVPLTMYLARDFSVWVTGLQRTSKGPHAPCALRTQPGDTGSKFARKPISHLSAHVCPPI
jgi:hypothetical protein